jgi:MFS family permease
MTSSRVPVARLWLAVLFGYLALGATLQELPSYLSTHFHVGPLLVGVGVGIAFAGTAVARPFAGRAGDAGWSRWVASGGAALTATAALGHLLAPDFGALVVARVAMGIGEAALFSGTLPWVLSATGPTRAGRVAGWFGLSMWGGLSIGPLLAVAANAVGGSSVVWVVTISLPGVSCALILSTSSPSPTRSRTVARADGWRGILPRGVAAPGAILGLAAYGYGTLTALLVLFLGTSGIGGEGLGLVVFSLAFLATRTLGSPVVDRVGGRRVAVIVVLVEAAGLALLAAATVEGIALLAVVVTGVGLGTIYPATSKLVLSAVDPLAAGAAMGVLTSFWDVGILVAGPVGGFLAAALGFHVAFAASAGIVLGGALLAIMLRKT